MKVKFTEKCDAKPRILFFVSLYDDRERLTEDYNRIKNWFQYISPSELGEKTFWNIQIHSNIEHIFKITKFVFIKSYKFVEETATSEYKISIVLHSSGATFKLCAFVLFDIWIHYVERSIVHVAPLKADCQLKKDNSLRNLWQFFTSLGQTNDCSSCTVEEYSSIFFCLRLGKNLYVEAECNFLMLWIVAGKLLLAFNKCREKT